MKKSITTLFTSLLIFFVLNSFGQLQAPNVGSLTNHSGGHQAKSPKSSIPAPPNSVLSYPPVDWTEAWNSVDGIYKCYQNFSGVSGSFNMVTIWGVNLDQTTLPYNLKVEFYSPSETTATLGISAIPLSSVTVNVTPVVTGETLQGSYQIFSYSIPVPTNYMTSGWVSVQAVEPFPATSFYWLDTSTAPANSAWLYPTWTTMPSGLSLVLSNSNPVTAVPTVSQWGLIILAFSLLVTGTVYILRRRGTAAV